VLTMGLYLRRTLLLLGLFGGSLAYSAHAVHAQLERGLLSGARVMLDLPASYFRAAPRDVQLNGARVQISSGRSELPLSALLDHIEAACGLHGGGVARLLAQAERSGKRALPILQANVLRAENEREGVVACLDLGTSDLTLDELAQRLSRFSERLDLAELGGVRLVRVQALTHGTFFVVAETQGPVPLAAMFPVEGDAPGLDLAGLPRPAQSRRILSTWLSHGEPAMAAYASQDTVDEAWAAYVTALESQGFRGSSANHAQSGEQHAELFSRAGRSALVVVTPDGPGSQVLLMAMDAGPGAVRVH
jgi:hypothetical protein